MTEDFRDIESELESLRPVEPSPALRWKVAGELEGTFGRWTPRRLAIVAASVASAAACVAVAVLLWRTGRPDIGTRAHEVAISTLPPVGPTTATSVPPRPDRPALGVYAAALSRSPDALDQLLDRQAAALVAPAGPSRRWGGTIELTN